MSEKSDSFEINYGHDAESKLRVKVSGDAGVMSISSSDLLKTRKFRKKLRKFKNGSAT